MGGKSSDPNKAAMKQQEAQMARLDAIDTPELKEYILKNPELVGLLNAEQIGPSAQEEISLDPALREKQMQALQSLQQQADEGLTSTDKYAMEQLLGDVASQEQSRQKQIENQMAAQGMDSSGAALMSKLKSSQSSANNARAKAMQMAAQGQNNRRQALQALGQQAGQIDQTDYGRQANLASAKDTIARFNAQNRQNVNRSNLAARQAIENQRTNTSNQQSQIGNTIAQQNFTNQIAKATGQGNVANQMSNIAGNTPQGPSGIQQLGTIAGGIAGGMSGGPAGIMAGAQAGGAIGGLFADGGVIGSEGGVPLNQKSLEDEHKQKAAFKKKYMKQIHDEMLGSYEEPMYAADGGFKANDSYFNKQADSYVNDKDLGAADLEAQNYTTPESLDKLKLLKSLGGVAGELNKETKKDELKLGSFDIPTPKNIMTPIEPQNYSNPFAADGGVINQVTNSEELPERGGTDFASPDDRKSAIMAALLQEVKAMTPQEIPTDRQLPAYEQGGVYKEPMYASDGTGDIIDSGMDSYAGDRVDAKVNDGEAIINVPQQQRMMDLLRGKINLTELGDDDIVEGVPKDYRDDLHEKIDGKDEKVEGLEKLIKLLGKS